MQPTLSPDFRQKLKFTGQPTNFLNLLVFIFLLGKVLFGAYIARLVLKFLCLCCMVSKRHSHILANTGFYMSIILLGRFVVLHIARLVSELLC